MPVLDDFEAVPESALAAVRAAAAGAAPPVDAALVAALADAESFRAGLQQRQAEQCARLAQRLPLPQLRLPYLFTAELGPPELAALATELAAGIEALDDGTGASGDKAVP
jgi:hypothetical protein